MGLVNSELWSALEGEKYIYIYILPISVIYSNFSIVSDR